MKSKDDPAPSIADGTEDGIDDFHEESWQEMRMKAERIALEKTLRLSSSRPPDAMEKALHELQVHQIELEMQNGELRQTQVELDASRARYFNLYDLAPVGYITVSEKGLILEANITAAVKLGVGRGALIKSPISRYIHQTDQDAYFMHRKQLFETGEAQSLELRMVRPDGALFWARLDGMLAHESDSEPEYRFMLSDVSERKEVEESLQKTLLDNRNLLRELQHRAKNSFCMISSMINIAAGSGKFPDAKSALRYLDSRVNSISELYSLLYSSGSFTTIRLDDYCARVAVPLVKMSEILTLELRTEELTIPVKIATPIGLILTELITNAVKYAFPGGRRGTITLSLHKTSSGARLELVDDGIGLPVGFKPAGTDGMGLNLVRALAAQIEGGFRIEGGLKASGGTVGTRCILDFILHGDGEE